MKIYQIHKYGGEWEDYHDYIVASYLLEEKALVEKEQLEKEEEYLRKCNSCPLYYCWDDCDEKCEECRKHTIERTKKYCDRYEPFDKDKHDLEEHDESEKCVNYYSHFDDYYFRIEEVDVIE